MQSDKKVHEEKSFAFMFNITVLYEILLMKVSIVIEDKITLL